MTQPYKGSKRFTLVGVRTPRVEPMMALYCPAAPAVEAAIQTGGDLRIERGAARCLVLIFGWCWRIVVAINITPVIQEYDKNVS